MTNIFAIESSCDETAAAVVNDNCQVLSNIIASQIPVHRLYGGVVPEIASRHHLQSITLVAQEALSAANLSWDDIDAIAVAHGPGLVGSLLVGVSFAKAVAMARGLPLIAVHHWRGHLAAVRLEHKLTPPFMTLVVSGSHSGLLLTDAAGQERLLGFSHDDAAGEAFDKMARSLGLPYPGGPEISAAAQEGNRQAYALPRAWLPGTDDFSFSGLKSALLNQVNQLKMRHGELSREQVVDLAASAEQAVCDVLSAKAVAAAVRERCPRLVLAGGVAANSRLRELCRERAAAHDIEVIYPAPIFCTDNAAMIAAAALPLYQAGEFADLALNAEPRLALG